MVVGTTIREYRTVQYKKTLRERTVLVLVQVLRPSITKKDISMNKAILEYKKLLDNSLTSTSTKYE
jgi:hypothetical protein